MLAVLKYFRRLEEINSESLLGQTFNSSKEIHTSGKESWYSGVLFIMQQLNINANMSLHEIKSKLIKRSMELWGKQLHGLSMFAVKAKIYGVLYNQASSIAFDETSSYWSAPKST